MTEFWIFASAMIGLAWLAIAVPLLRKPTESVAPDSDQSNVTIVRAQLQELAADLDNGRIDQTQYDQAHEDLEIELLTDLSASTSELLNVRRGGRWVLLVLIPVVPLLSVWLYQTIGSAEIITAIADSSARSNTEVVSAQGTATGGANQHQSMPTVDEMVSGMAQRMAQTPDDLQGWKLLARSYTLTRDHHGAVEAFKNIIRLDGQTADILASYADSLIATSGGVFTPKVIDVLQQALTLEPEHPQSLWLMGHYAAEKQDWSGAIDYWQRAAADLPPDGPDYQSVQTQIVLAQRQIDGVESIISSGSNAPSQASAEPIVAADSSELATSGIQVLVELDPALASAADPSDTVFVFARASKGPRMPLAIVKKQVKDLPMTVTLNDSQAMTPAMVLSKFSQVNIGARVSRSGQAMPQSGDYYGERMNITPGSAETVKIVIDTRRP